MNEVKPELGLSEKDLSSNDNSPTAESKLDEMLGPDAPTPDGSIQSRNNAVDKLYAKYRDVERSIHKSDTGDMDEKLDRINALREEKAKLYDAILNRYPVNPS